MVSVGVPRLPLHQVLLGLLEGEADGGQHVRAEVDAEDGEDAEGERDAGDHGEEEGGELGHVGGERVEETLLQVLEHESALLHAAHQRGEVVIQQHDVRTLHTETCCKTVSHKGSI